MASEVSPNHNAVRHRQTSQSLKFDHALGGGGSRGRLTFMETHLFKCISHELTHGMYLLPANFRAPLLTHTLYQASGQMSSGAQGFPNPPHFKSHFIPSLLSLSSDILPLTSDMLQSYFYFQGVFVCLSLQILTLMLSLLAQRVSFFLDPGCLVRIPLICLSDSPHSKASTSRKYFPVPECVISSLVYQFKCQLHPDTETYRIMFDQRSGYIMV